MERGHRVKQNMTSQKQGQSLGEEHAGDLISPRRLPKEEAALFCHGPQDPGGRHVSTVLGGFAVTGKNDKNKDIWLQRPTVGGGEQRERTQKERSSMIMSRTDEKTRQRSCLRHV